MTIRRLSRFTFLLFTLTTIFFVNSGFSQEITRNRMDAFNDPSGWNIEYFGGSNAGIVSSDSPEGGKMLRYTFPVGMKDGQEPATAYYNGSNRSEMYMQFYWKVGTDWNWHPVGQKIFYAYSKDYASSLSEFGTLYDDLVYQVWGENNDITVYNCGKANFEKGQWYKFNIHIKVNSSPGSRDGIVEVWVDDVQKVNARNVMFFGSGTSVSGISGVKLAAAYGGMGGSNPSISHMYYDDFIISTTPIGGTTTESVSPNSPINLQIR